MEVALVFIALFIAIFGIAYLYYNTRHKERLALIERDKDVSIFAGPKVVRTYSIWKVVTLNLGLVLIGVGVGILIAGILSEFGGMNEEVAFPAMIFLMSGIGLVVGYFLTDKMDKKENIN